jgi:predicted nucleotidyltransferase/biotin operon repressor
MKYSRPLDDLLGQQSKVKILRHLANTHLEMSGRQIASDIGMSPWACHRALQDLTDQGALVMRNMGRTYLFRLNEESYVVEELLLPLFQKEKQLLEAAIREMVDGLSKSIVSIILYGSVSRGEERSSSDLDVLVLVSTDADQDQIQELFAEKNDYFISRFGNVLSPIILSIAEFRQRYGGGDGLLREIVDTGRVIHGKLISEVLHEPQEDSQ